MKWEEISYFLDELDIAWKRILDIGCGNGRLLWVLQDKWISAKNYIWYDLSEWLLKEAQNIYPDHSFMLWNMCNITEKIADIYQPDIVFFIASFHHLPSLEDRIDVMKQVYNVLSEWWKIYMTNWSLESEFNHDKYRSSRVEGSEDIFWSSDYQIKIWQHQRYYHSFSLDELEHIFKTAWFQIIENREFENKKNIISIIQKPKNS